MNNSPTLNYLIGAFLLIFTAFSFVFLDGPVSVFLGIATAVGGALFFVMGAQGSDQSSTPDELGAGGSDRDWDDLYLRDFGSEDRKD